MPSSRALALIVLLLSILTDLDIRRRPIYVLLKSPYPTSYLAGGNYTTDCTTLRALDGAKSNDLKYCEDATFWELHGRKKAEHPLIVSCDAGRKAWNTVMGPLRDPSPRGTLWYYNPRSAGIGPPSSPRRMTLKGYPSGHDFHPLGLEIYPSHSGSASNLYVVNHARARTTIEQFVVSPADPTTARHVRTISSAWFVSPNALALTGPDSFYVANDHLMTRRLPVLGRVLPIIETMLSLPLGFVSHVTLAPPSSPNPILKHTLVRPFIPFANGIALSPTGTQVAVSSTTLGKVLLYTRDPLTNLLTPQTHAISVPFTPDNLRFTSEHELLVGGHPHSPSLIRVAANKTGAVSPSWVARLRPRTEMEKVDKGWVFDGEAPVPASKKVKAGETWTVETVFQSDGEAEGFQSSTMGLRDPDSGAVYVPGLYADGGLLVCHPGRGTV